MAKEFARTARVGEEIRRALSEVIREKLGDPRVGMVTITGVELSRDLAHAKIFASVLELANDEAITPEESIEALNHAAGHLRRELGHRVRMRTLPSLRFIEDPTEREAVRMDTLIRELRAQDDAAARRRGDDD